MIKKGLALGAVLATSGALLAGGISEASAAYPQTRPSAGQFCKARHVWRGHQGGQRPHGQVPRDGSYNRWRYAWR